MSFKAKRAARSTRKPKSFVSAATPAAKPDSEDEDSKVGGGESETPFQKLLKEVMVPAEGTSTPTPTSAADTGTATQPGSSFATPSEKQYTHMPPTICIKRTLERGRGLWTTVAIPAGTVIFSAKPHVHVISKKSMDLYCAQCGLPQAEVDLKKCAKCKTVYYCGAACQKSDWTNHKQECEALIRWAADAPLGSGSGPGYKFSTPPDTVRCMARMLWRRKKLGEDSSWYKELDDMQSHRYKFSESTAINHVQLGYYLVKYMNIEASDKLEENGLKGIGDLVDTTSKFYSNCFTLMLPDLTPIGSALIPFGALINHSCDPNVSFVFPRSSGSTLQEPRLHVVAIQDLPADTELFTNYRDITIPTEQRQKQLQETYFFTCRCSVCSPPDTSKEDWRTRLWCPKGCGGTCPIPHSERDNPRCSKCKTQVPNVTEVIDAMRVGEEGLKKSSDLQHSDLDGALQLIRKLSALLKSVRLTPSTHPLHAILRRQQLYLIDALPENPTKAELDEVIRGEAEVCYGLDKLLRPGHPVRGIALAELGKLLAMDEPAPASTDAPIPTASGSTSSNDAAGDSVYPPPYMRPDYPPSGPNRLALAVQTLRQAHAELRIGFGSENGVEGGQVGLEVRDMLVQLERELAVWIERSQLVIIDARAGSRARSGNI